MLNYCRLIKEGICDKSSVPSVSAISRLLRGRDEEEVKKTSKFFKSCIHYLMHLLENPEGNYAFALSEVLRIRIWSDPELFGRMLIWTFGAGSGSEAKKLSYC
jgi:hypothetical protein